MQKKISLIIHILFAAVSIAFAQPTIEWQKTFGGTADDCAYVIQQTFDKGYFIVGHSKSSDGDISTPHGDEDIWVIKLTNKGDIVWEKSLGGTATEWANAGQQTKDGGYVIVGNTRSTDKDAKGNHGSGDLLMIKLTDTGAIDWQKCFGGTNSDGAYSIQQTKDGGYIVAGQSNSDDGDVSKNNGSIDFWILKLTNKGAIVWEKSFGGTRSDAAYSIQQTKDGGYIVAGFSDSYNGDKTDSKGAKDYWVIKLTNKGDIVWEKSLGGNSGDYPTAIRQTSDGGYIVAGYSESYSGDITGAHPGINCWVVKLSTTGDIIWQKCFGGIGYDQAYAIEITKEGGYVIAGYTSAPPSYLNSTLYDVSGRHGGSDWWIVKLSKTGDIVWQKCLGGTKEEMAFSIQQTNDGGFIVAGNASSTDGDLTNIHGKDDLWVVKLSPAPSQKK